MRLTEESTYSEIKAWFIEVLDRLPNNLRGKHKYYDDVKFTVQQWIYQVDTVIKIDPKKVKENDTAVAAKANLFEMYQDLQKKEMWNLGLMTEEEYFKQKSDEDENE